MTYSKEQIEAVFKIYTEDEYTKQAQDILMEFFRQGFIHGPENVKSIYEGHLEWFAGYLKERDKKLYEEAQQGHEVLLETLKPAYEVLKPTVNPNACPCEFCRARDELIERVGRLLEAK